MVFFSLPSKVPVLSYSLYKNEEDTRIRNLFLAKVSWRLSSFDEIFDKEKYLCPRFDIVY